MTETITDNNDWTNIKVAQYIPKRAELISQSEKLQFLDKLLEIKNNYIDDENIDNEIQFKEFKISELFNILKTPDIEYKEDKYVHNISAKNNNNGVKNIIKSNKKTFYGNKIVLITGGDGGAGLAFYQKSDFNISSATVVLSPKKTLKLNEKVGIYLSLILSNYKLKYSRGFQWNTERILNDIMYLPITDDNQINYDFINTYF